MTVPPTDNSVGGSALSCVVFGDKEMIIFHFENWR
jgi:hypothetical protein